MTDVHMDYVATLPPEARSMAREWAQMPSEEFQARVGPAIDDIKNALAEMRTPFWVLAAKNTGLVSIGGLIIAVMRGIADNPSTWRHGP